MCRETDRSIKKSYRYENQIGLTVSELKDFLQSDTEHYKILIFFSPCCGPCHEHFKRVYKNFYTERDSTKVKFLFINTDCGGLKHTESYLSNYGINEQIYFIRDTTSEYSVNNPRRYNNILNYIFNLKDDKKITEIYGIPISCIVNKNNEVKLMKCKYQNDSILRTIPMPLHELKTNDITKINYTNIGETEIIEYDFCSPDGCE